MSYTHSLADRRAVPKPAPLSAENLEGGTLATDCQVILSVTTGRDRSHVVLSSKDGAFTSPTSARGFFSPTSKGSPAGESGITSFEPRMPLSDSLNNPFANIMNGVTGGVEETDVKTPDAKATVNPMTGLFSNEDVNNMWKEVGGDTILESSETIAALWLKADEKKPKELNEFSKELAYSATLDGETFFYTGKQLFDIMLRLGGTTQNATQIRRTFLTKPSVSAVISDRDRMWFVDVESPSAVETEEKLRALILNQGGRASAGLLHQGLFASFATVLSPRNMMPQVAPKVRKAWDDTTPEEDRDTRSFFFGVGLLDEQHVFTCYQPQILQDNENLIQSMLSLFFTGIAVKVDDNCLLEHIQLGGKDAPAFNNFFQKILAAETKAECMELRENLKQAIASRTTFIMELLKISFVTDNEKMGLRNLDYHTAQACLKLTLDLSLSEDYGDVNNINALILAYDLGIFDCITSEDKENFKIHGQSVLTNIGLTSPDYKAEKEILMIIYQKIYEKCSKDKENFKKTLREKIIEIASVLAKFFGVQSKRFKIALDTILRAGGAQPGTSLKLERLVFDTLPAPASQTFFGLTSPTKGKNNLVEACRILEHLAESPSFASPTYSLTLPHDSAKESVAGAGEYIR